MVIGKHTHTHIHMRRNNMTLVSRTNEQLRVRAMSKLAKREE